MDDAQGSELFFPEEVFRIQGAAFAVSNTIGCGFLEAVYQECLTIEFGRRGVPFRATPRLALSYDGVPLQQTYTPDFICFDAIVVELKAVRTLAPEHRAQVLNYLKAGNLKVGLLINFGAGAKIQIERFAL
ncbi:MAG: GxxExxY protein [Caulobacterales bacterium]|nr:GxxExxY protein [Caulobacterales bacterium]